MIESALFAWIANSDDGPVSRLDRKTGDRIGDPIKVGRNPRQLAVGFGSVWVTRVSNHESHTVTRIQP